MSQASGDYSEPSKGLLVHFVMSVQALLPRYISSFESEKSIAIITFLRLRPSHKPSYGLVRMIVSMTATVYRRIPSTLAFFVDAHAERTRTDSRNTGPGRMHGLLKAIKGSTHPCRLHHI